MKKKTKVSTELPALYRSTALKIGNLEFRNSMLIEDIDCFYVNHFID